MRVKGHTLVAEGAAFVVQPAGVGTMRPRWNSTSGKGFALCSCGARSAILDSANQRKVWHRSHKIEVDRPAVVDLMAALEASLAAVKEGRANG